MRTNLRNHETVQYEYNYWFEPDEYGDYNETAYYDEYVYDCPCGQGEIVETHDDTPGNREHLVRIICENCSKRYQLDTSRGVKNWGLVEMNNWDIFLESLNSGIEFDKKLKEYLEAMKYVSDISAENIDLSEEREKINKKLECIVQFIDSYAENYYEIGLIKGFKTNKKTNGNWNIDGRDYYYYIADQKMKASVYYVRYLNYIDQHLKAADKAKEKIECHIESIRSQIGKDIPISNENIISIIDDYLEPTEENQEIRQCCMEYIDQIKTDDMNYLKYMLFNNMMREIRYIGAAYQYLWHWEVKTKNLFRYASYDGAEITIKANCSKKEFLQDMFHKVISHMNEPSRKLCSYSEDPYIDIFKYLKIKKNQDGEDSFVLITPNSSIKTSITNLENKNTARFDILKGAKINSIYRGATSKSFYDFVQDGKDLNPNEFLAYAIELYPDLPTTKNSKNTVKNIKNKLSAYLKTWADDDNQLMSYVADDKEVVTYGKIEKNCIDVKNNIPDNFFDDTRYQMILDKEDLIYLLLKINKNNTTDKIWEQLHKEFPVDLDSDLDSGLDSGKMQQWIQDVLNGTSQENCKLKGKIILWKVMKSTNQDILIQSEIPASIVTSIPNPTLDSCKKTIKTEVEDQIKCYFRDRYDNILQTAHPVADFILRFIQQEGYECPPYIGGYNEYEPDDGDREISMLKYSIFKGWQK